MNRRVADGGDDSQRRGQESEGGSGGSNGDGSGGGGSDRGNGGNGGNGGSSNGDDGDGGGGGGQSDRQQGTTTVEKVVMGVSVAFTVLLFAYAGWQIVTPPQADVPQATVVGVDPMADGGVAVAVRLHNPNDVGLVSATVQSNCSAPPPAVEFTYVPAVSNRTGTLVCPPGTTEPSVSLANWVSR